MRNLAAALLLSHGVPMLQMGDEYGHSKAGNNNTYCHDSELNWMDWEAVEKDEAGFVRFMRQLIHFRWAGGNRWRRDGGGVAIELMGEGRLGREGKGAVI